MRKLGGDGQRSVNFFLRQSGKSELIPAIEPRFIARRENEKNAQRMFG